MDKSIAITLISVIVGPSLLTLLNRLVNRPKEYRDELRTDLTSCRKELDDRTEERDRWQQHAMRLERLLNMACVKLATLGEDTKPFEVEVRPPL